MDSLFNVIHVGGNDELQTPRRQGLGKIQYLAAPAVVIDSD
jgi:hypothetical protein